MMFLEGVPNNNSLYQYPLLKILPSSLILLSQRGGISQCIVLHITKLTTLLWRGNTFPFSGQKFRLLKCSHYFKAFYFNTWRVPWCPLGILKFNVFFCNLPLWLTLFKNLMCLMFSIKAVCKCFPLAQVYIIEAYTFGPWIWNKVWLFQRLYWV
jgi:hypothetical protein